MRGSRISLSNHCDALKTLCTQRIKEPALWKKKQETEQGMKIRKSSNFYGKETKITLARLYLMKKWAKNGKHAPQTSTPIQLALRLFPQDTREASIQKTRLSVVALQVDHCAPSLLCRSANGDTFSNDDTFHSALTCAVLSSLPGSRGCC